jgi:hypothetical protein
MIKSALWGSHATVSILEDSFNFTDKAIIGGKSCLFFSIKPILKALNSKTD